MTRRGDTYVSIGNMLDSEVHETKEVADGVFVDYRHGFVVGVEILGALAVNVDGQRTWTWPDATHEIDRGSRSPSGRRCPRCGLIDATDIPHHQVCPTVARDQVAAMREIEERRAGGAS